MIRRQPRSTRTDNSFPTRRSSDLMLKEAGARTIIAGHSERRTDQHESHEDVAAKASAAHGQGLNVILCVGETEAQRDAGDAERVVADTLLEIGRASCRERGWQIV